MPYLFQNVSITLKLSHNGVTYDHYNRSIMNTRDLFQPRKRRKPLIYNDL